MATSRTETTIARPDQRLYWRWFFGTFIALSLVCGTAAVVVPSALFHEAAPAPAGLRIDPQVIDYSGRDVFVGDKVKADFTIRNDSLYPIKIASIRHSCACSTVLPGRYGSPPFELPPGSSTLCTMTTSVRSRSEKQDFLFSVEAERDGSPLPEIRGHLFLHVKTRLIASPPELDLGMLIPGNQVTRTVTIGDTLKANPVKIVRAWVCRPELVQISCEKKSGNAGDADLMLNTRYEIRFTLKVPESEDRIDDVIGVELDDGSSLRIPVYGFVKHRYGLVPRRVTFDSLGSVPPRERTVFYRFSDPSDDTLELQESAPVLSVQVLPFNKNSKVVRIRYTGSAGTASPCTLIFAAGRARSRLELPVDFHESDRSGVKTEGM